MQASRPYLSRPPSYIVALYTFAVSMVTITLRFYSSLPSGKRVTLADPFIENMLITHGRNYTCAELRTRHAPYPSTITTLTYY